MIWGYPISGNLHVKEMTRAPTVAISRFKLPKRPHGRTVLSATEVGLWRISGLIRGGGWDSERFHWHRLCRKRLLGWAMLGMALPCAAHKIHGMDIWYIYLCTQMCYGHGTYAYCNCILYEMSAFSSSKYCWNVISVESWAILRPKAPWAHTSAPGCHLCPQNVTGLAAWADQQTICRKRQWVRIIAVTYVQW